MADEEKSTAEGNLSHRPRAATAVREMVFRNLYRGQQVYGKTRWERRAGTKRKIQVPEAPERWIRETHPSPATGSAVRFAANLAVLR